MPGATAWLAHRAPSWSLPEPEGFLDQSSIAVGHRLPGLTKSVTQEQIRAYADAAGDHNPIHLDEEYAASTQFGRRIAHGMLVLAFASEMLSTAFPSEWPAAGHLKVRFKAPVYPGETVRTEGEAVSAHQTEEGREIEYRISVLKQDGTEAIAGQAIVRLRKGTVQGG
ncbi:MAG: MaoC family dehydratase [Chloroflexi bacterium]|nr:MaoC family dehydratase [Chloroflexota bacterium]